MPLEEDQVQQPQGASETRAEAELQEIEPQPAASKVSYRDM